MVADMVVPGASSDHIRINGVKITNYSQCIYFDCVASPNGDPISDAMITNCLLRQMAVDAGCAETVLLIVFVAKATATATET